MICMSIAKLYDYFVCLSALPFLRTKFPYLSLTFHLDHCLHVPNLAAGCRCGNWFHGCWTQRLRMCRVMWEREILTDWNIISSWMFFGRVQHFAWRVLVVTMVMMWRFASSFGNPFGVSWFSCRSIWSRRNLTFYTQQQSQLFKLVYSAFV